MSQNKRTSFFLICCALTFTAMARAKADQPTHRTVLKGRVVAKAQPITEDLGTFFSYSETFIFELAQPDHKLVKLSYEYWNKQPRPPESFLDYSVLRSLKGVRNAACDESLEHMAYTQGFDSSGHFGEHQFTLKKAKDAPEVKTSDAPLPCYVLKPADLPKQE